MRTLLRRDNELDRNARLRVRALEVENELRDVLATPARVRDRRGRREQRLVELLRRLDVPAVRAKGIGHLDKIRVVQRGPHLAPVLPLLDARDGAIARVVKHDRYRADPVLHRRLVTTNWLRTIAWTLRALLVCVALWALVSSFFCRPRPRL
mgnify:CR=1 FL=1